jgi:hypothetical protein
MPSILPTFWEFRAESCRNRVGTLKRPACVQIRQNLLSKRKFRKSQKIAQAHHTMMWGRVMFREVVSRVVGTLAPVDGVLALFDTVPKDIGKSFWLHNNDDPFLPPQNSPLACSNEKRKIIRCLNRLRMPQPQPQDERFNIFAMHVEAHGSNAKTAIFRHHPCLNRFTS